MDDPIASNGSVDSEPATDPSTSWRSIRLFYCSNRGYPRLIQGPVIATTPGVLKSALGGDREYFHSQTLGDSDRLKPGETGDFIQHRGIDRNESEAFRLPDLLIALCLPPRQQHEVEHGAIQTNVRAGDAGSSRRQEVLRVRRLRSGESFWLPIGRSTGRHRACAGSLSD